jgi:hypothetical protein
MARRVAKVEQILCPRPDPYKNTVTLEELYRSIWKQDKVKFLERAQNTSAMLFKPQFEREDAHAAEAERRFIARTSNSNSRSRYGS